MSEEIFLDERIAWAYIAPDVANLHPLAAALLVAALFGLILLKRQYVPIVLLTVAVFVSSAQRLVIAGADFNLLRLVAFAGVAILLLRGEFRWIRFGWIDWLVALNLGARIVCVMVLWADRGKTIWQIGNAIELTSIYLVFRCCIRSLEDLRVIARALAVLLIVIAPFFIIERATGRNVFSVFGGLPDYTIERDGRLRCQGAFSHAILAGCFAASFVPLWIGMLFRGVAWERLLAVTAIVGAGIVIVCCASSTPLAVFALCFAAWVLYPVRYWLRYVYLAALLLLVFLHLSMKAPVWHLISRLDLVGGSTGDHRYRLISGAIEHFSEWWMVGTKSTAHWGWGLYDVTNQYLLEAVTGGIWAMIALMLQVALALATAGALLRMNWARRLQKGVSLRAVQTDEALVFGFIGVVLVQMTSFLAVSYYGQTVIVWQLAIAVAASLRQVVKSQRVVARSAPATPRPIAQRQRPAAAMPQGAG